MEKTTSGEQDVYLFHRVADALREMDHDNAPCITAICDVLNGLIIRTEGKQTIFAGDEVWSATTGNGVAVPASQGPSESVRVLDPSTGLPVEFAEVATSGSYLVGASELQRLAAMYPSPIPTSERLPEVGQTALLYFPGISKIWAKSGKHWATVDVDDYPTELESDTGQWSMLTVCDDGWLRCHGTQLRTDDAKCWLPLPPKPE